MRKAEDRLSLASMLWHRYYRQRRMRPSARADVYAVDRTVYADDRLYANKRHGRKPQYIWLVGLVVVLCAAAGLSNAAGFFATTQAPDNKWEATIEKPQEELFAPQTLSAWDRSASLDPNAPPSAFTSFKLRRADRDGAYCAAALALAYAEAPSRPDENRGENCGMKDVVRLASLSNASLTPVVTRCAIALRMYMWERHDLQPLAREIMGSELTSIQHMGSYSCRKMRTTHGHSHRMSQHATANAIDISGFEFADGTTISLTEDWGESEKGRFLKAARDAACARFNTVLGPDFNSLHEDHFHFDQGKARICR